MSDDAAAVPSGEVTFLFTDMEGSTAAWDAHGQVMDEIQIGHDEILRRAIAANRGYVFSTGGDGLAAGFWTANEALLAATRIQAELATHPWPGELQVRVRMGLHTGRAIERSGDYFGPTVIRAARLMGLVAGRRIAVSAATRASLTAVPDGVQLVPVGKVRLKGLSDPEDVFGVVGAGLEETGEPIGRRDRLSRRLPHASSDMFGREHDRELVGQRLLEDRLVSIVGPGGVGKTRLATAVIDDVDAKFPDGIAYVELATVTNDDDVLQSVADVVGVIAQAQAALLEQLCNEISGQRMLLVYDNCEHVIAGVRELATEIIGRCRGVVILTTSREPLDLTVERVVYLEVLDCSDPASAAVDVLSDRIGRALSDDEAAALPVLAGAVDGLPLALELVAARARSIGVTEVLRDLRDHGIALGSTAGQVPAGRHSSIEALLDWSYGLLDPFERQVFACLSTFAHGFTVESATDLCIAALDSDVRTVRAAIGALIAKSMIVRRGERCLLLELTQRYGQDKLDESGSAAAARRAHRRITTEAVEQIHDGLRSDREAEWVETLAGWWPDVRLAVRSALEDDDAECGVSLAINLCFEAFWRRPEALAWIRELTNRFEAQAGETRAALLGAGGFAAWVMFDVPAGVELGERALAADSGPAGSFDCLPENAAIGAYVYAGRLDDAGRVCGAAIEALVTDPARRFDFGYQHAARAAYMSSFGLTDESTFTSARLALGSGRAAGNPTLIAYGQLCLGLASGTTSIDEAARLIELARETAGTVGNHWIVNTASLALTIGRSTLEPDEHSLDALTDTAREFHQVGWTTHAWGPLWSAVPILWRDGRRDDAATALGACSASGMNPHVDPANPLPDELKALLDQPSSSAATVDPGLRAMFAIGEHMSVPEVVRLIDNGE